MDLGIEGKVALVAASSKGLGKASAMALAREGAKIAICARTEETLEATAVEIRVSTGADVFAVPADLDIAEGIDEVVGATRERLGEIDILVDNSGGPRPGRFGDLTDDDWRAALEVVTLNLVRFVRAVTPSMRERHWGRIVCIQSSSVKQPVGNIDLSNGLRPGIAGLAKAIMPDLAKDGITINLVLPGTFLTDRIRSAFPAAAGADDATIQQRLGASIPVGRLGAPEEAGDLVAFLASERAAYITGAAYQIDGGAIGSNV